MLHVTSQAVSRWENGEVEPSVDTISNLAKIFGVTTDEVIGGPDKKPKPEVVTEVKEKIIVEQAKPVLAICDKCKRPIYKSSEIVSQTQHFGHSTTKTYICTACDKKIKEQQHKEAVWYGESQRKKSFIFGTLIAAVVLIASLILMWKMSFKPLYIVEAVVMPILAFTFIGCLFLRNNFIEDLFISIASWSIHFPGILFSFDIGGFIFLIVAKIAFWIIGWIISIAALIFALIVCLTLSLFVYPYAIVKNIRYPELTEN